MNKKYFCVAVAIILVLGGLFWWFQLRPYFDRKGCSAYAASMNYGYNYGPDYEIVYKGCLNGKGY